ncbi:MAG: class I SAM-dependent methyltransferase [Boseongicola sp.]
MNSVKEQYEAFPYPERDPKDESQRLILGSPSMPAEIDHCLFGGRRDWSGTFRALVAGGGTGDGLIMLAQLLQDAGRDYAITYIDLSESSREIAEGRAKARGLQNIEFITGSLVDAPRHGSFDYIDCCGVLHHLPDPQAGFDALAGALAPQGGIGLMVYAPYGRSGVYPLQEAFGKLLGDRDPKERLREAKKVYSGVPDGHPFRRNPHLSDHLQSDAGFYDLLLHSFDRPFRVSDLAQALDHAGLAIASFSEPGAYDLRGHLPKDVRPPKNLSLIQSMGLAEMLSGSLKTHVVYATHRARAVEALAGKPEPNDVPHFRPDVAANKLADAIARAGRIRLNTTSGKKTIELPKASAALLAKVDGRRDLAGIAAEAGLSGAAIRGKWNRIDDALRPWGLLHYSWLNKR